MLCLDRCWQQLCSVIVTGLFVKVKSTQLEQRLVDVPFFKLVVS